MRKIPHSISSAKGQSGAVLIVSLIMLLLMTIIGVTAMQGTVVQERMAGNLRDKDVAFQSAELALRDGEDFLDENLKDEFDPLRFRFRQNSNGLFEVAEAPRWNSDDLWNSAFSYSAGDVLNVAGNWPRLTYIQVPSFDPCPDPFYGDCPPEALAVGEYRVMSRSRGASGESDVIIESTVLF